MYTNYGSKSKVLSEDVVPTTFGDSYADRLDNSSNFVSKSKTTGVPNGYIPAIILKTEKITVSQIPVSHNRAGAALKVSDLQGNQDTTEAITVHKHYAIVAGSGDTIDIDHIPPELLIIIYEIGESEGDVQNQVNRKVVVEMLGDNYGVLKVSSGGGLPYNGFDLNDIEGGIPDKYKRPIVTTELQNKNAYMIIIECKKLNFNNRQISNFLGMALGESGMVPQSEYGPSKKTSVARLRKVYVGRVRALSDSQLIQLRDSGAVKFFNYVYHGPMNSARFNEKLKRSGAGNTIGGYKYRGRGFIQHTGFSNYKRLGKRSGKGDLYFNQPDLLNQPEHAAVMLAAYYNDPQVHRNNKRDFNKIKDTYEATYGGSYSKYNAHHKQDVLRRGGFALNYYKKLESGEWKSWKDGGAKVAKTKKAEQPSKEEKPS
jgi:hypothetical protein